MTQARKSGDCTVLGRSIGGGVSKTVPDIVSKKEPNLLERERHDTSKQRGLTPCTCPDEVGHRFEEAQKRRPGSVGTGGRRVLESVGGMDRNTQPPTKIDPQLSRQSGTFHRQTVRVRGSMRSSFGVSVSIVPDGW